MMQFFKNNRAAVIAGIIAAVIAAVAYFVIGQIYSGVAARRVLEAMNPSARILSSAAMTSSATILALMLTLLGLSNSVDYELDGDFYQGIQDLSLLATVSLMMALTLLMIIALPITEENNIGNQVFTIVYYMELFMMAIVTGTISAVVYQLYQTIVDLINVVSPGDADGIHYRDENQDHQSD